MKKYGAATYGQQIAEIYDDLYSGIDSETIEMLADFAKGGPALELGIGTGRVALPLKEKGVDVYGIDASEEMVAKLRDKPGGNEIEVQIGSFREFQIEQRFNLIFVVFNTFFGLQTQEEQVQCLKSVREHLTPGGVFLIDVFVPDLGRFTDFQTVRTIDLMENGAQLEVSQVDPVSQQVTAQHIFLSEQGVRFYPVRLRYAWPSELDLMAQIAGLSLRERWGSWSRAEFTKESRKHISVYENAPG